MKQNKISEIGDKLYWTISYINKFTGEHTNWKYTNNFSWIVFQLDHVKVSIWKVVEDEL